MDLCVHIHQEFDHSFHIVDIAAGCRLESPATNVPIEAVDDAEDLDGLGSAEPARRADRGNSVG